MIARERKRTAIGREDAGLRENCSVIPTMLLVGLLVGRAAAVPVGAGLWAAVLLLIGTIGIADVPLAAALAGANVAVGAIVRWLAVWPLRRLRT
jgi:hypothetical protein